jgi:peptide/nickel transport system permease protein
MIRYVLKRLVAMLPTLIGITMITFLIISLAPGDPVQSTFQQGGTGMDASEGGGSGDQDRLADAVKAKKQLLGIMAKDLAVLTWPTGGSTGDEPMPIDPTGRLVKTDEWPRDLELSADGKTLVLVGDDRKVRVLNLDGEERANWIAHDNKVWSVAVSQDGKRIATADRTGEIALFSLDGRELGRLKGAGLPVRDLLFLADNRLLAASDSGVIWRLSADAKREHTFEGHVAGVYALEFSGVAEQFWSGGVDRIMREWDPVNGKLLQQVENHGQAINDIARSADGGTVATACDDKNIRVFPTEGNILGEPRVCTGHWKQATSVAISADGKTVYGGSRDETVRSWDATDCRPRSLASTTTGRIHDLLLMPNGTLLSTGDTWRKVPMVIRYLKWAKRLVLLDFGRSFVDDEPVIEMLAKALPITIGLNVLAIFIIYGISLPIGIYGAIKRAQLFDNASSLILFILYSVPNFWLATLFIMFFSSAQNFNILPSGGLHSPNHQDLTYFAWLWDWFLHLILPVTVMVYAGFASLSRYVRTSMLEVLSQDYVRTARAKGLVERVVVLKHAFRNALIVIVTLVANLLPKLIGGSVIVEYIFSINGMGKLGFDAILSRDYPVIMAITTFSAVLTLAGILVSDLLYSVVDPRVTVEE